MKKYESINMKKTIYLRGILLRLRRKIKIYTGRNEEGEIEEEDSL